MTHMIRELLKIRLFIINVYMRLIKEDRLNYELFIVITPNIIHIFLNKILKYKCIYIKQKNNILIVINCIF